MKKDADALIVIVIACPLRQAGLQNYEHGTQKDAQEYQMHQEAAGFASRKTGIASGLNF